MPENLLTRVATTLGSRQAENIASGALVYLLERYPPARVAFVNHLRAISHAVIDDAVYFSAQVDIANFGITDISGVHDGAEQVIIEAKIAAGLHGHQVTRYIDRLRPTAGLLVILAPRHRLPFVWHDVCEEADIDPATSPVQTPDGKVTLASTTWEAVIDSLAGALAGDAAGRAELQQVEGLYRHIEEAAFIPYSPDDLSFGTGRLVDSIGRITKRVLDRLRGDLTGNLSGADWSTR